MQINLLIVYSLTEHCIQLSASRDAESDLVITAKHLLLKNVAFLKKKTGVHQLSLTNDLYYVFINQQKIILLNVTEFIPSVQHETLATELFSLNDSEQVKAFMDNNDLRHQLKIKAMLADVEKTKLCLLSNLDKLMDRHEKIETIDAKSNHLVIESKHFLDESKKLKNRYRCNLFFWFQPVSHLISKAVSFDYHYKPWSKA